MWIILLDHSGSMGQPFTGKRESEFAGLSRVSEAKIKLDAAKHALLQHLRTLPPGDITLIEFTSTASVVFEGASNDLKGIQKVLDSLYAEDGTDISVALDEITRYILRKKLGDRQKNHQVLVISDGLSDRNTASESAIGLAEMGVIGSLTLILIDPTDEGEAVAQAIRGPFNGFYWAVTSPEELSNRIADATPPDRTTAPSQAALALPPPVVPIQRFLALAITPPILPWLIVVFILGLSITVLISIGIFPISLPVPSIKKGTNTLLFLGQMVLLTASICLIPTIIYWFTKRRNRLVHVAVESLLFIALFLGFGLWMFGRSAFGSWIFYAAALILLIEAGSHIIEWHKDIILKRLSGDISFKDMSTDADAIKKMFHHEQVLYVSPPVGLIIGIVVGLLRRQMPEAILLYCFQFVLLLASLILLCFLILCFQRMCDPMFKTDQVSTPMVAAKKPKSFWSTVLEIVVPPPPSKPQKDPEQKDLNASKLIMRQVPVTE
jgi:von Willebrand factor type A domain